MTDQEICITGTYRPPYYCKICKKSYLDICVFHLYKMEKKKE